MPRILTRTRSRLRGDGLPLLVAAACGGIFVYVSARHLDRVPPVYEDEPWQASTAYKLMTRGVFGSDLFAGFHDMQARYYGFLPLHPLVLALDFRLLGVGLPQARLETVACGLVMLVLTFVAARTLVGAWPAAVACGALVCARWTGLTYLQPTGIPLVDLSRIARYDPLAATVGLASFLVYLWARRSGRTLACLAAGALAGLSGLAHLYGLFWVVVLLVLATWDRVCGDTRLARLWLPALVGGALLPWLPYGAYVAADIPDWRGQTAGYANRFELLNPGWYLDNLVQEYHRYGPGLGPLGPAVLARIGVWVVFIGVPAALAVLSWRAFRRRDAAARAVVVPGVCLPVLFALLIHLKLVNYTLLELPIEAIALGWLVSMAWRNTPAAGRLVLLAICAAVCVEGGVQLAALERAGAARPPYSAFAERVRAHLSPDASILGLHTYWFGLSDLPYRSFLVPLLLADEGTPLDQTLDEVPANTLLLDARLRAYFGPNGDASEVDRERFSSWMRAHDAQLVGEVDDPTYGLMQIYRLRVSATSTASSASVLIASPGTT